MRWLTAGESHGAALVAILDGMPAGVALTTADVASALARRRLGYGRGARQAFERDATRLLGGVIRGRTTGAPIAVEVANSEWPKWSAVMSPDPVDPSLLARDSGRGDPRELARNRPLTRPRPGHADLAGMLSYDLADARPVLERASARETAARVALSAAAEQYLRQVAGTTLVSHVVRIGAQEPARGPRPAPGDVAALDASPVRTLDAGAERRFVAAIDAAHRGGDTVGGVVEVVAYGVPVGLGTYAQADRRLDARLAGAVMSIPSVKAVEIGDGFEQAALPGSAAHDAIVRGPDGHLTRASNHAGGMEGGMSNGQPVVIRAALKPISTVPRALPTVDLATGRPARAIHQRSDTCAVVPGAVVAQAVAALVLADALGERIGGASLGEARRNLAAYRAQIEARA